MKVGRPTVMTETMVKKLEEAFAFGATDAEACFYAGITKQTLYSYQKKFPEFVDRKEALKQRPILLARKKVVDEIEADVKNAQWYLEKKAKDFTPKAEIAVEFDPAKKLLEEFGLLEGDNEKLEDKPRQH